jgi:hypothetical protein
MFLIITIDTEEDNWGHYSPTGHTNENIKRISYLQDLFNEFDVKPTYLVTYPVATDKKAVSILRKIVDKGKCEIGSHCHPWNTPPFEEENTEKNSMLCNLPTDLQYRKMKSLHNVITETFGSKSVSFRAGRYGFSHEVARNLNKLGYRVDTSITPFWDWTADHGPDFSENYPWPYRFSCDNVFEESPDGPMVEVPVTIGFLQKNFSRCNRILKNLSRNYICKLKLIGIMYRLHLLNRIWLSPEFSNSKEMIKLTQMMTKKNYEILNMTFHSSSLIGGLSPFVKTKEDERQFGECIKNFLAFTHDAGIVSIKLSDVISLI